MRRSTVMDGAGQKQALGVLRLRATGCSLLGGSLTECVLCRVTAISPRHAVPSTRRPQLRFAARCEEKLRAETGDMLIED